MSTMTVRDFALALARPLVRRAGNDETFLGGVRDRARAAELLATIWACRTAGEVENLLRAFASYGTANELQAYVAAAKAKSWAPDARDTTLVRKAGMASAVRAEVGKRALFGWDVARYTVLAGWAGAAGLLREAKGLALLQARFEELIAVRKSFAEVAREVALGHRWAFGTADEELDRIAAALEPLPWPASLAGPPARGDDEDEEEEEPSAKPLGGPVSLSVSVSVDCPGCASVLHFRSLGDGETCRCATRVPMERDDWVHLLQADVSRFAPEKLGEGELTNDFGDRWYSRRAVRNEAPRCPRCDGPLALEALLAATSSGAAVVCGGCSEPVAVRPADDVLRALHPAARGIAGETPNGFTVRPADVPCLGCSAGVRADGTSRILRCACGARTWVDDAAWRAIAGPERRPRWILLLGG